MQDFEMPLRSDIREESGSSDADSGILTYIGIESASDMRIQCTHTGVRIRIADIYTNYTIIESIVSRVDDDSPRGRIVSSDGTRSPEITMNPNRFGLLVTCLPKRAAPTPQYHASKDKLNHGPSCHPQSRSASPLDRYDVVLSAGPPCHD